MKLTALLLLVFALHLSAKTVSQTITLSGDHIKLEDVLKSIKAQTGYTSFYNDKILSQAKPVNIHAVAMPLEVFLAAVFSQQRGLQYTIKQTSIVISRNINEEEPKKLYEPIVLFEDAGRTISGFVYDEKNLTPIRGVTVTIVGTNKATQTDENGRFVMKNIEGTVTLSFTSIGFEKQLRKLEKDPVSDMVVMLKQTSNELDQAVVQAYGITSKRLATGNITKVTGEEIRRQPVMNPLMSLQGKVPGLIVTPVGAASSGSIKVEIRGKNSVNPNVLSEPLYVIDGVPQTVLEVNGSLRYGIGVSPGFVQGGLSATKGQSPLFSLNPRDIESIEVLKDGDATAIYGSRAANGVILITTRKARPGKTIAEFNIRQGIAMVPKNREMLSTAEYIEMRKEAFRNANITPTPQNAPDLTVWDPNRYTNWYKEILGTGKTTSFNAGISGGDAKTSFRLNGEYSNQVDLFSRDGHNKRASFSFNMNHRSENQKFTAGFSAIYSYTDVNAVMDNTTAFTLPPNAPPIFDEKGDLNFADWNAVGLPDGYPFSYILQTNSSRSNSLNSSLRLGYELMKGLTVSVNAGYTQMQNKNDFIYPMAAQNPISFRMGSAIFGTSSNSNWIIEPEIRYSTFIGKGNLTVQAGATTQSVTTTGSGMSAMGYTDDDMIKSIANAPAGMIFPLSDGRSMYKYAALFGRISYDWDRKYILTLNGRRDGSSRFVRGKQYGNFGSVGAAWLASEEDWMEKIMPEWFSFLKFRGSYAVTGNDGVKDYEFYPQWATVLPSTATLYEYNGTKPFVPVVPANQQFQWEVVKKLEAAIQLGFWQDRVNVEFSWYRNRSGNQLTTIPMPAITGFAGVTGNWAAVVDNKGIEASLGAAIIRKKDMSLSLNFNIGRNMNKLVRYPGIETSTYSSQFKVGQSLSTRYFFHYLGVNPLTGEYVFEDYNKDGKVAINGNVPPGTGNDDRYIAVDMNPAFSGGFGANLNYKNVSLVLGFSFTKTKGSHPFYDVVPGGMRNMILPKEVINNHWRNPGDNALYAKYSIGAGTAFLGSDREVIDASYLRLNNIALSYQLPEKIVKLAGMQSCQFSVNAQNIFTITSYQADPEIQFATFVPIPRLITASLSFNF